MSKKRPTEAVVRQDCTVLAKLAASNDTNVSLAGKLYTSGLVPGDSAERVLGHAERVLGHVKRRVGYMRRALDCGSRPAAGMVAITWLRRFGD